jgi:uncharacterized membrane protein
LIFGVGRPAHAAFVTIHPGPLYDPTAASGYADSYVVNVGRPVTDAGVAIGQAMWRVAGANKGFRAFRWDAADNRVDYQFLGTDPNGKSDVYPYNLRADGVAFGAVDKYVNNSPFGPRPVRWDAQGNVTELGTIGLSTFGATEGRPFALSPDGTRAAGYMSKYVGSSSRGYRAVRWDSSGNATDLGTINTDSTGMGNSYAEAINDAGVVVGEADRFATGDVRLGRRAVRWDTAGTLHELPNLGLDTRGSTFSEARSINAAGIAVGDAQKFTAAGASLGQRPARWDVQGNLTEMEILSTLPSGLGNGYALVINDAGTVIGGSVRYAADGSYKGERAVRWDAAGHIAELGNLGTDLNGLTTSAAMTLDDAGAAVGWAESYVAGVDRGRHAMYWAADGTAVDLNSLIDPTSGWTLTEALGISPTTAWIAGNGLFDPDGAAGPQAAYNRAFLIQVPEPASWVVGASLVLLTARRRRER